MNTSIPKIRGFFSRWNERSREHLGAGIGGLLVARIIYQVVDWLLDNPVDAIVVYHLQDPLLSFVWIFGSAAAINLVYLKIYEKTKVDWLGIGAFKKVAVAEEEHETLSKIWNKRFSGWWKLLRPLYLLAMLWWIVPAKIILWGIRRGRVVTFIVLSIWQDSFVTTAFFRHGKQGDSYRGRDWAIYIGSLTLSCAYWTLRWELLIAGGRFIWNRLF